MPVVPQNVGFQDPGVSFMMPSLPNASGMQSLPLQQVSGVMMGAAPSVLPSQGESEHGRRARDV